MHFPASVGHARATVKDPGQTYLSLQHGVPADTVVLAQRGRAADGAPADVVVRPRLRRPDPGRGQRARCRIPGGGGRDPIRLGRSARRPAGRAAEGRPRRRGDPRADGTAHDRACRPTSGVARRHRVQPRGGRDLRRAARLGRDSSAPGARAETAPGPDPPTPAAFEAPERRNRIPAPKRPRPWRSAASRSPRPEARPGPAARCDG